MFERVLAICGWLAWQVRRPFGRRSRLREAPNALAVILIVLAALPIVVPMFEPQPQDVTVQDIVDDEVDEPTGWVRLHGRVAPLRENPTERPGQYALLVDQRDPLDAIVLRANRRPRAADETMVTGHLVSEIALVEEELPIEATVYGTPPVIIVERIVELDPVATPARMTWWPLSIPPLILAAMVLVGARSGYPIFRPTTEVDVLSVPLAPGERVPAAFGGRLGPTVRDLADPGAALLVVRPGPKGDMLTAQPLADKDSPAPPPVVIGGGSATGRIGWVFTASEAVPALRISAEHVDVTLLFAKTGERDRVAALLPHERG